MLVKLEIYYLYYLEKKIYQKKSVIIITSFAKIIVILSDEKIIEITNFNSKFLKLELNSNEKIKKFKNFNADKDFNKLSKEEIKYNISLTNLY